MTIIDMQPSCARFRCKELYSDLYGCTCYASTSSLKIGSKWQKMEDVSSTVGNECVPYKHQNDYKQIVLFYKSRTSAKLTRTPLSARHMNVPQIVRWPENAGKSARTNGISFLWCRHRHSSQNLVGTSRWNTFWNTFPPKNTFFYSTPSCASPDPRSAVFHQADLTKADYGAT